MSEPAKTILIIGASRGLGLGLVQGYLARGWNVMATTRGQGDDALRALAQTHPDRLRIEPLDVTRADQLATLKATLGGGALDVLFVSAGVTPDKRGIAADIAAEDFDRVMRTNALAPLRIVEALGAQVARDGAVVVMTSVLGSVGENESGGNEVYRASKAALNTLLRSYAARQRDRALVAMHPGWVRTDMGGSNADVDVEESVAGMIDVIAKHMGRPGCVFVDYRGHTIAW